MQAVQTIYYTTTIEVIMSGQRGRFPMHDNELLRGRKIVGCFIRRQDANDKAISETGGVLIDEDAVRACLITFQVDQIEKISSLPLEAFYQNDYRLYTGIEFNGFNPQKSYIEVLDATDITANEVVELNFIYQAS